MILSFEFLEKVDCQIFTIIIICIVRNVLTVNFCYVTRMDELSDLGGQMIPIESPLLHSIQNFNLLSHSYIC